MDEKPKETDTPPPLGKMTEEERIAAILRMLEWTDGPMWERIREGVMAKVEAEIDQLKGHRLVVIPHYWRDR